jgi:predicted DNA-binding transcriptional regulator AlpA
MDEIEEKEIGYVKSVDGVLLLAADKVAMLCGVSKRTFWRWESRGCVPRALWINKTKRWRKDDILAWIGNGCPSRE